MSDTVISKEPIIQRNETLVRPKPLSLLSFDLSQYTSSYNLYVS